MSAEGSGESSMNESLEVGRRFVLGVGECSLNLVDLDSMMID